MKMLIAICFMLLLIIIAGCVQKYTDQESATDESAEVSSEISEADSLDKELDTSDVDTIADDLEDIDW